MPQSFYLGLKEVRNVNFYLSKCLPYLKNMEQALINKTVPQQGKAQMCNESKQFQDNLNKNNKFLINQAIKFQKMTKQFNDALSNIQNQIQNIKILLLLLSNKDKIKGWQPIQKIQEESFQEGVVQNNQGQMIPEIPNQQKLVQEDDHQIFTTKEIFAIRTKQLNIYIPGINYQQIQRQYKKYHDQMFHTNNEIGGLDKPKYLSEKQYSQFKAIYSNVSKNIDLKTILDQKDEGSFQLFSQKMKSQNGIKIILYQLNRLANYTCNLLNRCYNFLINAGIQIDYDSQQNIYLNNFAKPTWFHQFHRSNTLHQSKYELKPQQKRKRAGRRRQAKRKSQGKNTSQDFWIGHDLTQTQKNNNITYKKLAKFISTFKNHHNSKYELKSITDMKKRQMKKNMMTQGCICKDILKQMAIKDQKIKDFRKQFIEDTIILFHKKGQDNFNNVYPQQIQKLTEQMRLAELSELAEIAEIGFVQPNQNSSNILNENKDNNEQNFFDQEVSDISVELKDSNGSSNFWDNFQYNVGCNLSVYYQGQPEFGFEPFCLNR